MASGSQRQAPQPGGRQVSWGSAGPQEGAAIRIDAGSDIGQNQVMGKSVLIVDDHPSFRASARRMLEADGYGVVGEAEDGAAALAAAEQLRPDLVLLDVRLPDIDGFEVARRLLDADGRPRRSCLPLAMTPRTLARRSVPVALADSLPRVS